MSTAPAIIRKTAHDGPKEPLLRRSPTHQPNAVPLHHSDPETRPDEISQLSERRVFVAPYLPPVLEVVVRRRFSDGTKNTKTIMNRPLPNFLLCVGLVAAVACLARTGLRAQPSLTPEQIAALQQIDPSTAPECGNYWLVEGRYPDSPTPPLPCIPTALRTLNLPIYALGTNQFLIDDSSVDYAALDEASLADPGVMTFGAQDDDASYTSAGFPSGSLWLSLAMTNDPTYGNMAAITLNGTTNDTWYEVLSKSALTDSNWWSEGSLQGFIDQALSQSSVTADNSASNVFLWVRTLTNGSGNTLPISWQLQNFGRTGMDPNYQVGSQGSTLLQSYLQGTEPNLIQFSVTATNNYVQNNLAAIQLKISGGFPYYQAVLVDSTNSAGANWSVYTSTNVTANLGSAEGWHSVWVGLKGFSPASTQTWQWKRLKLDYTPPALSLLSPTLGVVSQPTLQLVGSCPEPLSRISYDLWNAAGFQTNQQVLILNQFQNTNTWEFTTNTFQAFDVKLAIGTNLVTLHATDLAGNQTTTNLTFILDYSNKTNPPALQLAWPQDGAEISAGTFTLQGWTDDPTATVRAQVIGTNGIPSVYLGLVERTGKFWVDNVPLKNGTNVVALTLTDAVGHSTNKNISLTQSAVRVTMNPVTPASQLWQPTVNISGTISSLSYAVWVNGVKANNPGNGTWSATNVPVSPGGTAVFLMTAYSPTEQQPDGSYGN